MLGFFEDDTQQCVMLILQQTLRGMYSSDKKPETLVECFLAQPELDGAKSNLLRTPKSRSPPDLNLAEMIFKFARKKQYARLTDFDILQKTMLAIA